MPPPRLLLLLVLLLLQSSNSHASKVKSKRRARWTLVLPATERVTTRPKGPKSRLWLKAKGGRRAEHGQSGVCAVKTLIDATLRRRHGSALGESLSRGRPPAAILLVGAALTTVACEYTPTVTSLLPPSQVYNSFICHYLAQFAHIWLIFLRQKII